jgi:hypothetical protein
MDLIIPIQPCSIQSSTLRSLNMLISSPKRMPEAKFNILLPKRVKRQSPNHDLILCCIHSSARNVKWFRELRCASIFGLCLFGGLAGDVVGLVNDTLYNRLFIG